MTTTEPVGDVPEDVERLCVESLVNRDWLIEQGFDHTALQIDRLTNLLRRYARRPEGERAELEAGELRSCPFCGGPARRVDIEAQTAEDCDLHGIDPNAGGSYIECRSCLCCTMIEFGRKENLASNWNRRAMLESDARLEAENAALRAELAVVRDALRRLSPTQPESAADSDDIFRAAWQMGRNAAYENWWTAFEEWLKRRGTPRRPSPADPFAGLRAQIEAMRRPHTGLMVSAVVNETLDAVLALLPARTEGGE